MADNDEPGVPVVCSECGTDTRVPLAEVAAAVERHNERLHDGEDVARVDPDIAAHVADLVAEDMGLVGEDSE